MKLGNFSISLAVKDIKESKDFYEKLGFEEFGGVLGQNWLIMKNESVVIGLFQGMFESNIMTFNPGWDGDGEELDSFTDIRELHKVIKDSGIKITSEVLEGEDGPGNFTLEDPDGNTILFDQHV